VLHDVSVPEGRPYYTRRVALVVDTYPLGPIQTNCYVVRAERGANEAAVVDPGADAAQLRLELAGAGASCAAILITHGHYDHLGAVADLAEGTGAPVYMPEGERMLLEQYRDYAPPAFPGRAYTPDHVLAGGETVDVAGIAFETVSIPGHSPAHIAYHADGCLFSGDLLFAGSVGRVDIPGGDWDTLLASVRTLAERYDRDTVVYPGHGPQTTLGRELDRNPFLAELRA
jgi:glyoxylase-like metal-dependent hydrolase (beta-lactamase superfamily II)